MRTRLSIGTAQIAAEQQHEVLPPYRDAYRVMQPVSSIHRTLLPSSRSTLVGDNTRPALLDTQSREIVRMRSQHTAARTTDDRA